MRDPIGGRKYKWCEHCNPRVMKGCGIYESRPKECKEYLCMWVQMENVGVALRPDNCHVVFDKTSEEVICASQDSHYTLNTVAKNQIRSFVKQGFSVGIINGNDKKVALARGHKLHNVAKTIEDYAKKLMEKRE